MVGSPYSVSLSQVRKDEILQHSHGRAPWYDMTGTPNQAYVIGIAGGSASGKVSFKVEERLPDGLTVIFSMTLFWPENCRRP